MGGLKTIPLLCFLIYLCHLSLSAAVTITRDEQQPITIMDAQEYKHPDEQQRVDSKPKSFEMENVEIITDNKETGNGSTSREFRTSDITHFQMTLRYFSKVMPLQMKENRVTLRGGVKLISYAENGTRIVTDEQVDNCRFYQGFVINDTESAAAISICDKQLEGAVMTEDHRYIIEPSKFGETNQPGNNGVYTFGPHSITVYPRTDDGNNQYGYVKVNYNDSLKSRKRRDTLHLTETKYVELYLVNDKSEFVWLGSNTDNNMRRMKQITNMMDTLYQPYNVRVVFKALEVWNTVNKMTVNVDIHKTLDSFLHYRRYTILPASYHDNAQLVSHIDFTGPTIGLAPLRGMCREEHSANVNQDTHHDFGYVATTMAHEMGHNLGMEHDPSGCVCRSRTGSCIMSKYAQDPYVTKFSECSRSYLEGFLRQEVGACLMNKPSTGIYYEEKLCGNNKLDPGEDCDCGYPKFCQNPCCNAHTCKFTTGSECSTGACCNSCKLKTKGTTCRETGDTCDIRETCDGTSGQCPDNLYKTNGSPCNEHAQDGYCYDGYCRTFNGQCKRAWGASAYGGDSACYANLNGRGDQHGNCGTSGNYYVRCGYADKNCGKMFCEGQGQKSFPVIGYGKSRTAVSFVVGGRKVHCRSGATKLGQSQPNIFLIQNGVQCYAGKACLNQRCVPVSQIKTNPCPGDCNGHGTCTNKGTCICNAGWAPPDCKNVGSATVPSNIVTTATNAPTATTAPTANGNTNGNKNTKSHAVGKSRVEVTSMLLCLFICFKLF